MSIENVIDNADKLQKRSQGIFRQGNLPPTSNTQQLLNEKLLKYLLDENFSKDIFADLNTKNPYADFKKLILEDLPIEYRKILSVDRKKFKEKLNVEKIRNKDGQILNDKLEKFFVEYYKYEKYERNKIIRMVKKSCNNLQTISEEEEFAKDSHIQIKSVSPLCSLDKKEVVKPK